MNNQRAKPKYDFADEKKNIKVNGQYLFNGRKAPKYHSHSYFRLYSDKFYFWLN